MNNESATRIAKRFLQAMAYNRETFKDKVEEHVGGAYLEFYKATLAKKIGQSQWVQHWTTEVRNLLDRNLVTVIKHEVRGFKDRRKALVEVIVGLKAKDESYRRSAEHVVKRDYKLTKLPSKLDDKDTEAFWAHVDAAIEAGFAGETETTSKEFPKKIVARYQEKVAFELAAMANLRPRATGIAGVIIWLSWGQSSGAELKHGPRIKVIMGDKLTVEAINKAVSVKLTDPPQVIGTLPGKLKQQVLRFIELNRQALIDHWKGTTDTQEFGSAIQKI